MWFIKPKYVVGSVYACQTGDHAGKLLIFMDDKVDQFGHYGFITTPELENLWIPEEQFDLGLENEIIEYVEKVPRFVRKTLKAKFEENEKTGLQSAN